MKKILLASAVLTSLAFGLPSAAEAHSSFKIYFGVPYYSYNVGPGYEYRRGYGWHRRNDYREQGRLTCGEARHEISNRGYYNISAIECSGSTYTFRGWKNGRRHQLLVNSRSGAVWRG